MINKKWLAIIPARSGTKGLKDKNILKLNGKHLIFYTIDAALTSRCFDNICVSTDSKEYARISEYYGAEVPFIRSPENSNDEASSWDVVKEVLANYEKIGMSFNNICLLQPTSPLRDSEDIKKAVQLFINKDALFVESVVQEDHSPLWSNTLDKSLSLKDFIKPENNVRRQDLPIYYRENGAIYLFKRNFINDIDKMYGAKSYAYIMDKEKSIDIDSKLDLLICESLMKIYK